MSLHPTGLLIERWSGSKKMRFEPKPMQNWDALKKALAEAVMDVVTGIAKRELLNYQIEKLRESKPLNGRVALYHVFL